MTSSRLDGTGRMFSAAKNVVPSPTMTRNLAWFRAFASTATRPGLPAGSWAAIMAGLLVGALWGVVARIWMRVISAEYEFTLNGTLSIIGIFAVFGLGQTVAAVARRSARSRKRQNLARAFAVVTTVPMGLAAGAQMFPTLVLAAVALGRTDWRRVARVGLALLAAAPTFFVLRQLVDDLSLWRALLGWVLMLVIYAPLVWTLSRALRPIKESLEGQGLGFLGWQGGEGLPPSGDEG